MKRATENDPEG